MPYLNKRNRFVAAAKQYADANNIPHTNFSKSTFSFNQFKGQSSYRYFSNTT